MADKIQNAYESSKTYTMMYLRRGIFSAECISRYSGAALMTMILHGKFYHIFLMIFQEICLTFRLELLYSRNANGRP